MTPEQNTNAPTDVSALLEEVARLREALRQIASGEGYYGAQASEYKSIARQALNMEGPDDHL